MARELIPLKIKITLKTNKHACYPDFNQLEVVKGSGMDWSVYIDVMGDGLGWHYDQTCGHREVSEDSPFGQQWGMLIVPEEFVNQAIIMFPDLCTRMTEIECESFYNEKAHIRESGEIINNSVLESIKLKQDLNIELTDEQLAALDVNDPTPGITKNKNKIWQDHKAVVDISIKEET